MLSWVGAPAVPVAVDATGLTDNVPEEAVRVFGPAVGLSVQEVRAAIPSAPVLTGLVGVTVPLPAAGVNVTATCATGFPFASFTITEGGVLTAVPAVADWLVGLFAAIVAAAPAVPVAVNVTGLPDNVPELAVKVLQPAVALSVQLPSFPHPRPSRSGNRPPHLRHRFPVRSLPDPRGGGPDRRPRRGRLAGRTVRGNRRCRPGGPRRRERDRAPGERP